MGCATTSISPGTAGREQNTPKDFSGSWAEQALSGEPGLLLRQWAHGGTEDTPASPEQWHWTHTLAPSIFLCYSSCGPQHGKHEAPDYIPSQSDVAHSVRARRKPPAAQSDSKINTNSGAEAKLLCRTSWRDTSVGASTHWEQRDPECCTIPLSVPLSVPEGIPCPVQLSAGPRPWRCVAVAV